MRSAIRVTAWASVVSASLLGGAIGGADLAWARRQVASESTRRRRVNESVITTAIEALKIRVLTAAKSSVPVNHVPPWRPLDQAASSPPRPSAAAASTITRL
jgi:hypothetical protein